MTDNRTEPLFQGTTNTNTINLGLTTLCTMRCPKCSLGMVEAKAMGTARHVPLDLIMEHAKILIAEAPLRRVHLTGGEPTMHPNFDFIAEFCRRMFHYYVTYVTIETNGTGYMKYRDLFRSSHIFDKVFITAYVKDKIYPGNFDNTEIIELAKTDVNHRLVVEPPVVHERQHLKLIEMDKLAGDQVKPCTKWYKPGLPSGWYDGQLYSCCVSYGIDSALGIPVTPDWRDHINKVSMGCERCLYRGT